MVHPDFTVDQESGARWAVYSDPNHVEGFTILTDAGVALMGERRNNPIRGLIRQYRAAEIGSIALLGEDPDMRQELGTGQEATVYSMGPYAVREVQGVPGLFKALGELQRMDAINDVIEHGLPRWLTLPAHYALHADPKRQKTYTLMDRVNGGLTVEDVIKYPDIPEQRAKMFEAAFGSSNSSGDSAQEKVPQLYDEAYEVLAEAIRKSGRDPSNYLTDWKPRNALVEKLKTPVAGSKFHLSIIDQYQA
jgi:hypothetical protein